MDTLGRLMGLILISTDGRVYHDATGNWAKDPAHSSTAAMEEKATTHNWEMRRPGRHGGGNEIRFFDGRVKRFKDWTWGAMTMRRHGPFPRGDKRNTAGSDYYDPEQ
jgi:hypothetical protein